MNRQAKRHLVAGCLRAAAESGFTDKQVAAKCGVTWRTVMRIKAKIRAGETLEDAPRSGRPRSCRAPENVAAVSQAIQDNPRQSIRKLAKKFSCHEKSMRNLVHHDLGMKSRTIQDKPRLTESTRLRRMERCKFLLNFMKSRNTANLVRIFSDEKLFHVDAQLNRRNSRYLSDQPVEDVDPKIRFNPVNKHPQKVMVLGVVGSDGKKCPMIFIDANEKVNRAVYERLLDNDVIPWILKTYPDGNFVFQQDGAPAHTASSIQQKLTEELGGEAHFWRKEMWPPQSPDLNPLDYSIWSVLQEEVQGVSHPNVEALKAHIVKTWEAMDPAYIIKTCQSFRSRVEKVIAAEGGYIE